MSTQTIIEGFADIKGTSDGITSAVVKSGTTTGGITNGGTKV